MLGLLASVLTACSQRASDAPGPPPAGSFADALQETEPLLRAYRIAASLQSFGPEDVASATAALQANSTGVSPDEVRLLMLAWARFDAPGVFAWAQAYPGGWRARLMDQAAFAWGYRDGPGALAAIEALGDEALFKRLRPSVMEGWLRGDDKAGATRFVAAIDDARRRRRLTFTLAGENLRHGTDALVRWAEEVPEDAPHQFKQGAFYHAASMLATADPQRAQAFFEAHGGEWYSEGALPGIARHWVDAHEPEPLFPWLVGLALPAEREKDRAEAVEGGFRNWMRKDPTAAEAWLRAALPEPKLEAAVVEVVSALALTDPVRAVTWLPRIEDAESRHRATIQAGRRFFRRDPQATEAWLEAEHVPEEVRRQIRTAPPTMAQQRKRPEPIEETAETALP